MDLQPSPLTVMTTSVSCGAAGCKGEQLGHVAEAQAGFWLGSLGCLPCSLRAFLRDYSLCHKSKK